ncbi:MAG: hypothetical protein JWO81_2699 [Alphaproteobacteria bacterium]|nr:hypothetical protein [Alphaproteobacteria bacterium]
MNRNDRDPGSIVAGLFLVLCGAGSVFLGGSCSRWAWSDARHTGDGAAGLSWLILAISLATAVGGIVCFCVGLRMIRAGWNSDDD